MSVVRDPGDLYEVSPDAPVLDGAVMLHYLDGFIDAGAAGKMLSAHCWARWSTRRARFDVDRLIDYTVPPASDDLLSGPLGVLRSP